MKLLLYPGGKNYLQTENVSNTKKKSLIMGRNGRIYCKYGKGMLINYAKTKWMHTIYLLQEFFIYWRWWDLWIFIFTEYRPVQLWSGADQTYTSVPMGETLWVQEMTFYGDKMVLESFFLWILCALMTISIFGMQREPHEQIDTRNLNGWSYQTLY